MRIGERKHSVQSSKWECRKTDAAEDESILERRERKTAKVSGIHHLCAIDENGKEFFTEKYLATIAD
jgi:hypothetical protein